MQENSPEIMILEEIHRTYQSVFMATVNKSVIREPCQL
jgi:hypothetical protein